MLGFIQSGSGVPPSGGGLSRRKKMLAAAGLAGGLVLAAVVTQNALQVELTTSSVPPGIVETKVVYHDSGTTVSVPPAPQSANGHRFAYWKLNGVRQENAFGIAVNTFGFKILENTQAVATYYPEGQDTDGDGVPDWFVYLNYGNLSQNATSDTDMDGVSLLDEYLKGSQPRIPDSAADGGILEGGISRRRGDKIAVVVGSDWHFYSESSTPPGVVSRQEYLKNGTQVTTANLSGEYLGHRFTQWKLNGVRQENEVGAPLSQVTFTINGTTAAVAEYVPIAQDLDRDGVPDWYEIYHYGTTKFGADSDTDGDERGLRDEYLAGTQPRISDSASEGIILEGGISRRRGDKIAVVVGSDWHFYSETSTPPGVVSRQEYLKAGAQVTTANLSGEYLGHRFVQWKLNEVRQETALGTPLSQVTFTINGTTAAVAEYVPIAQDLDRDEVPDWFEIYHYGKIDFRADSDTDGDGRWLRDEYLAGTQPRIADSAADGGIIEGGISRRRGENLVLNLQFFRPTNIEDAQGNGFFSNPYSGANGSFDIGAGNSAPALGDINRDGRLDLVVGGSNGSVQF